MTNSQIKKSPKICKEYQEINLKTGRCRKKCNDNQERNIEKDRCLKKCNDNQERNPETSRCKIKYSSPKKIKFSKKSPKKQLEETTKFIDLCEKIIMTDKLDHVITNTWLNNNDNCNIFLIGEEHLQHNNSKCIGILDMFRNLLEKNTNNEANIDLFIEILNEHVVNNDKYLSGYHNNNLQMNNIRNEFMNCIKSKKCPNIRVHWADPTMISKTHKRYKEFPFWLQKLQEYKSKNKYEKFTNLDEIILKDFNPYDNENDILKLLTENAIVMKEIRRASRINPNFEIEKIKSIFLEIYHIQKIKYKHLGQDFIIFLIDRTVMDFYTIARIIKLNLKNVIIYAGNSHTDNIIFILNKYFGFNIEKKIIGKCNLKTLS